MFKKHQNASNDANTPVRGGRIYARVASGAQNRRPP